MSVNIQIKVEVPDEILNSTQIRQMIMNKMQSKTAPDLKRMFGLTVNGWKNKPVFLQKFVNHTAEVSTTIWPGQGNKAGKTYALVNQGSPSHPIGPRRRGMLVFFRGYRAASRPRVLGGGSASRFGEVARTTRTFTHPGFEAREFDKTIAEQYADTFVKDMQDSIHVAVVKSS